MSDSIRDEWRFLRDILGWFHWLKARLIFYPTLCWNMLLGRGLKVRNWWDEIDETVIIGALPFARDVQRLSELGVTGVVNTCQEYAGPESQYDACQIEQFRVPTIDFTHPSLDSVEQAVEFIERQAAAGGKVYVHCKAGRARSATVVVAWLMKAKGMTRQAAQELLLEKRPHANPRIAQRPVILEFEKKLAREKQ
jgi:atypical dual specificity phosphatase